MQYRTCINPHPVVLPASLCGPRMHPETNLSSLDYQQGLLPSSSIAKPFLVAHGSKDAHFHHSVTNALEKQYGAQAVSCRRFTARSVHAPAEVVGLGRILFAASRGYTHRAPRTIISAGAASRIQVFIFTQARRHLVETHPSPFRRLRTSAIHVAVAESAADCCVALTVACITSADAVVTVRSGHAGVLELVVAIDAACPAIIDVFE
ncbi:hypothetical protein P171DRAFT_427648 [Karstenula rhodostoma CBS 690.94]|uniref:Uncharacterized protein n=1 Tax=Karstenula rhodostoma CBS 690.94 TaxID=1392251 RepID=A0A9P4UGR6_9PLEO|nr:hypothetical protein P171DRAFT_427648 [Karstenula rhodostoma CBS 690.94]